MANHTDPAHRETEKIIKQMEAKVAKEYANAYKDIQKKYEDYLRKFETKDKIWQGWVEDGTRTKKEYEQWRIGQIAIGKRWSEMKQTLATDMHNANNIARSIIKGYMPEVYAINHNYATFEAENGSGIDTSYTLYDRDTVERLLKDDPMLMPDPTPRSKVMQNILAGKDIKWNRQQIDSVMLQGILQGESIDKMANRLMRVTTANYNSSVRYARTMATSAQNAGRYNGYRRAERKGIDLSLVWAATLDERTRISHRELDGQRRNVDEPFNVDGVEIYYPGDLGGADYSVPGNMVWNCRCTIIAQVKGFEYDIHGKNTDYSQIDGDYEDWKKAHRSKSNPIDLPRQKQESIAGAWIRKYMGAGLDSDGGSGNINYAKVTDVFSDIKEWDFDEKNEITPDKILVELEKTSIGNHAIEFLTNNNLHFSYDTRYYDHDYRASQQGNKLTLFVKNNANNFIASQSVVHEVAHREYGIERCQLAEAICMAKEKMHKENREFIYDDEWNILLDLAARYYDDLPLENNTIRMGLEYYVKIVNRKAP